MYNISLHARIRARRSLIFSISRERGCACSCVHARARAHPDETTFVSRRERRRSILCRGTTDIRSNHDARREIRGRVIDETTEGLPPSNSKNPSDVSSRKARSARVNSLIAPLTHFSLGSIVDLCVSPENIIVPIRYAFAAPEMTDRSKLRASDIFDFIKARVKKKRVSKGKKYIGRTETQIYKKNYPCDRFTNGYRLQLRCEIHSCRPCARG